MKRLKYFFILCSLSIPNALAIKGERFEYQGLTERIKNNQKYITQDLGFYKHYIQESSPLNPNLHFKYYLDFGTALGRYQSFFDHRKVELEASAQNISRFSFEFGSQYVLKPEIGLATKIGFEKIGLRFEAGVGGFIGLNYESLNHLIGVRYHKNFVKQYYYPKDKRWLPQNEGDSIYLTFEKRIGYKLHGIEIGYSKFKKGKSVIGARGRVHEPKSNLITLGYYQQF